MGIKEEAKNGDFIQFSREYLQNVAQISLYGNQTALEIFMFICEHMDGYNALMASFQVLTDYTGKSRSTCARAVKWLYDNGFVDILKSGNSNVYIVNQKVAWTSYANQRKYCKFSGNMLISAAENKDWFYRSQHERVKKLSAPNGRSNDDIDGQMEIKDTDCHIA